MFFEDMFTDIFESDFWLPIIASTTEDEERDFKNMTNDEIKEFYESED